MAKYEGRDHYLEQDVYEWAGELRDIDLSKGNSYFANHPHIASAAELIFQKLAKEGYLKGSDVTAFSERAAYYLGEINALHPFREGNGRAQREFIKSLGLQERLFHRVEKRQPDRHGSSLDRFTPTGRQHKIRRFHP